MKLIALMFVPFAFTTGAFVFSGVLEPMAAELDVSVASVATLQSAFAIACALCGPVLAQLTRRLPPRPLLLSVLALLVLLNGASAAVSEFRLLFALRVLVGGIGALAFPLATVLAVSSSDPEARAKAVSIIYAGIPMALILGIPLGAVAGNAAGWPASFLVATGICASALVLVWRFVPPVAARAPATGGTAINAGIVAHLGVTFFAVCGLFAMVGLIGPIIRATTGFDGAGIATIQFLAGVSSLAGVRVGAWLLQHGVRQALLVPFLFLGLSLVLVWWPLSQELAGLIGVAGMVASVCFGPSAQSATGVLVQSRLAGLAGPNATLVFALNGSMIYLGQGLGIVIGAAAMTRAGLQAAPLAGLGAALPGIALALLIARSLTNTRSKKEAD